MREVYVGSVWLLAGQSNVVLSLSDMLIGRAEPWHTLAQQQLDALFRAPLPDVRIFQVGASAQSCGVLGGPSLCLHTHLRCVAIDGRRMTPSGVEAPANIREIMLHSVQVPIYTSSANTSDLPVSGVIEPGNQRSRQKGAGSWEALTGERVRRHSALTRVD